jgi:broad specificity phosphatase PhoE
MEMRLLAIRHGETAWSRARRFAGSRDVPLTADGRRQCAALVQALAGSPVAAVYASPLVRARESAEPLVAALGLPLVFEPDFREMCFGEWEGLTRDEVSVRYPDDYAMWSETPERFAHPGGETLTAVATRTMRALAALRAKHDKETVVLVSHGIVIRLLVLAALGLGPDRLWSIEASPAGISEIEYRDDWVTVHRVNTLAHLEPRDAVVGT